MPNETLPTVGNPLGNPAYPVRIFPCICSSLDLLTSIQGYTGGGGINWVDVDTTVYNKSLILTYNYAYGGATIDASLVTPYLPTVLSLKDQVNEFLDTAAKKPASTPWTSENSLFSIWIGINDIGNSYGWTNVSSNAFGDLLLNTEFALVEKLVSRFPLNKNNDPLLTVPLLTVVRISRMLSIRPRSHVAHSGAGARNFLWVNVPPIDRSPLVFRYFSFVQ